LVTLKSSSEWRGERGDRIECTSSEDRRRLVPDSDTGVDESLDEEGDEVLDLAYEDDRKKIGRKGRKSISSHRSGAREDSEVEERKTNLLACRSRTRRRTKTRAWLRA
jgi:hypothetical protein